MQGSGNDKYRITFSNCSRSIGHNEPWGEDTGRFRLDVFLAEKFPILRAVAIPKTYGPPRRTVPETHENKNAVYENAVDAWDEELPPQIRWPEEWLAKEQATGLTAALVGAGAPPKLETDGHMLIGELLNHLNGWLRERLGELLPPKVQECLREYMRNQWRSHVGAPTDQDWEEMLWDHLRVCPKAPSPVPMLSGSVELAIVQGGAAPDGEPVYWSEPCHFIDRVKDVLVSETWGDNPTRDEKGWLRRDVRPCETAIISVHFRGSTTLANWLDKSSTYAEGVNSGSHWLLTRSVAQRTGNQWLSLTIPSSVLIELDRHDHQHTAVSQLRRIGATLYADCYWHNEPPMLLNPQLIKVIGQHAEENAPALPNSPSPNYRQGFPWELDRLLRADRGKEFGGALPRFDGPIEAWQIYQELGELWWEDKLTRTEGLLDAHRMLAALPEELLRRRFSIQGWQSGERRIDVAFCSWLGKIMYRPMLGNRLISVLDLQNEVYRNLIKDRALSWLIGESKKWLDDRDRVNEANSSHEAPQPPDFSEFLSKAFPAASDLSESYRLCGEMNRRLLEKPPGHDYADALVYSQIQRDDQLVFAILLGKVLFMARNLLVQSTVSRIDLEAEVVILENHEERHAFRISADSLSKLYRLVVGFLCFLMSPRHEITSRKASATQ